MEILSGQQLFQLLARQPLELGIAEGITLDVRLASHDAALEEKRLLAALRDGSVGGEGGLLDDVGDGDAADDPGVHVDASGLIEGSLGGLFWFTY